MRENRFQEDEEQNEDDEDDMEREGGRNLRSYALLGSKMNEVCSFTSEDSCNADSGCSWCKSAAVKAKCNTLANAKKLPAAVFSCSKINPFDKPNAECEGLSKDKCNADKCSWCISAAVKPACRDPQMAAKLPPAVF